MIKLLLMFFLCAGAALADVPATEVVANDKAFVIEEEFAEANSGVLIAGATAEENEANLKELSKMLDDHMKEIIKRTNK